MKILLTGNPNVGKSVLFNRLTGMDVISSNYPGTTIDYAKGHLNIQGERAELIDVPGIYSLEPSSRAEEIAVKMLKDGNVIISVIDATNLERNLYLVVQVLELQVPMILALNMSDRARNLDYEIDDNRLSGRLGGTPVIFICARSREGLGELRDEIVNLAISKETMSQEKVVT